MNNENYENYLTTTNEGLDINAHNIEVECITSSKDKFSLDCDGNLTVNSINFNSSENNLLSFDAIFDKIYPVGAIYISTNEINPGTLFVGTWEQIVGKFLLASNNSNASYALGKTGGTISHTHKSTAHTHGAGKLAAAINFDAQTGIYTRWTTDCGAFTATGLKASKEVVNSSNKSRGESTVVYGTTASTTPGDTGSSSNMPPFLSVNVWKRVS